MMVSLWTPYNSQIQPNITESDFRLFFGATAGSVYRDPAVVRENIYRDQRERLSRSRSSAGELLSRPTGVFIAKR